MFWCQGRLHRSGIYSLCPTYRLIEAMQKLFYNIVCPLGKLYRRTCEQNATTPLLAGQCS